LLNGFVGFVVGHVIAWCDFSSSQSLPNLKFWEGQRLKILANYLFLLAVPTGIQPLTFGFGNRCSIPLKYGTDLGDVYFKICRFESAGLRIGRSDLVRTLGLSKP